MASSFFGKAYPILDPRTSVVAAYLDGKALELMDNQKKRYEKYRNRPRK